MSNTLEQQQTLRAPNDHLVSANGQATLKIHATGNMAIYTSTSNNMATWSTATAGREAHLVLQDDGNLVLYSQGRALWATDTATGHRLVLHDDGRLVLSDASSKTAWTSSDGPPPQPQPQPQRLHRTSSVFDRIYTKTVWGDERGTKSGAGSTATINRTRNLFLAFVVGRLGVTDVYDICGDCNWQRGFMRLLPDVTYFGMDVSAVALQRAQSPGRLLPNMVVDSQPVDVARACCHVRAPSQSMFLLKEVIQHLPLAAGLRVLKNIKNAGVKYLAVTHHDPRLFDMAGNTDVETGGFYANDMLRPPFNFRSPLFDVADFLSDDKQAAMGNLLVFDLQRQPL